MEKIFNQYVRYKVRKTEKDILYVETIESRKKNVENIKYGFHKNTWNDTK